MHAAAWVPASTLEWLLLLPIALGSAYSLACLAAMARLRRLRPAASAAGAAGGAGAGDGWPPLTLLKPVCGLEKGLLENLRSACLQDYPDFQVIFSIQEPGDPALPLLLQVQREFGPGRVEVVIGCAGTAPNGKIRNLLGALPRARHDLLVISDSDVRLRPDYLQAIVAPLAGAARAARNDLGCVCTFYRATGAASRWEALEQLTLNADFVPSLVFARVTGVSPFLLGASTALRRETLEEIGGLAALSDYLVEDFEMGRRILATGKRIEVVPYFVDMIVDLAGPAQWWHHQVYWDQNTRSANPWGHFGTLFVRAVPFALLLAALHPGAPLGWAVLAAALAIRLGAAGLFLGWGLGDRTGLRHLHLLPWRDLAGFASSLLALVRPTVVWRGARYGLTRDGRMVAGEPGA